MRWGSSTAIRYAGPQSKPATPFLTVSDKLHHQLDEGPFYDPAIMQEAIDLASETQIKPQNEPTRKSRKARKKRLQNAVKEIKEQRQ